MSLRRFDAIVIGAGAAGLMCAITAGQRGARVLVVDHANKVGKKILVLGQGDLDRSLLEQVRASGWRGPVGILNHTDEDAETRLKANLDGLDHLVRELPPAAGSEK